MMCILATSRYSTIIILPSTRRVGPMSAPFLSPPPSSPVLGVGALGATVFSVECPVCDHANPAGAKYCNDCGSRVHLAGCSQCDAINERESAFCYKCGAPMGGRTSAEREAEPVALVPSANDAATDADHGSITIAARSATPEPAIAGCVVTQRLTVPERAVVEGPDPGALATTGSPVKPVAPSPALDRSEPQEPSEETASRPRTSPLDVPILEDRPMHFIDDAHPAIPYGVSIVEPVVVTSRTRRRSRGRRTTLTVGLLLVLFATAAIAVFAHYRPGAIDRTIATARSAMAVSLAPPKRDAGAPDAPASSSEPSGLLLGAHAAEEPGTRSISTAPGSASVRPPTQAPVIAGRTPARTPGAGTRKAPIASAHSRSPTSAGVSARRPFSTSTSDPAGGRNGSAARPVPCTAAVVAVGLCTPAAQSSDR
jgi:hypothetical protein